MVTYNRSLPLRGVLNKMGCIEFLEQRIAPATIQLLAVTGSQNWNDTGIWSGGVVPTSADDVVIDSSAGAVFLNVTGVADARSITMAADETLVISSTLNIAGGIGSPDTSLSNVNLSGALNLGADSNYHLSGNMNWGGSGVINGPGELDVTAAGVVSINSGAPDLATTLRVEGTLYHYDAYLDFVTDNASIEIAGGGMYQTSNSIYSWRDGAPGTPVGVSFESGSTFRNTSGNGFSIGDIPVTMTNALVDIVDGNIHFTNNVTFTDVTFNVAASKTLNFSGINAAVNGTLTKTGTGNLVFSGGTLTANAGGVTFDMPQMFWAGDSTLTGGNIEMNGDLFISSGSPNLNTELTMNGTLTHWDAYLDFTSNNAAIIVPSGSTYLTANSIYSWRDGAPGTPVGVSFESGSTFRNTSGNGFSIGDIPVTMTNALVDIVDGNIHFTNNVTFTDVTFNVAASKTLNFSGINAAVNGTLTKTGTGNLVFSGGTLTANAGGVTFNVPQMYWAGDSTLTGGNIEWNGDLIASSGSPNLNTELTINGTMAQGDAYLDFNSDNASIIIPTGSIYLVANSSYAWREFAPGTPVGVSFESGSTFRSAGPNFYTGDIPVTLTGALVDIVEGNINFSNNVTFTDVTFNVATGRTLTFSGINAAVNGTLTKTGAGTLVFSGGTLTANAAGVTFNVPQMYWAGDSTLTGGNIEWNGDLIASSGSPNLNTELTMNGTMAQGDAYLDFTSDNASIIILSGSTYLVANSSYAWREFAPGTPVGVSFESGSTFRSAGPNFYTGDIPVTLTGALVDIVEGNINFSNNVTFTDVTFNVATGRTLTFSGINAAVNGTLTKTGAGTLVFSGGTLTANAGGVTFNVPLMYWAGDATLAGGDIDWNGNLVVSSSAPNLNTELSINGTMSQGDAYLDFNTNNAELVLLPGSVYVSDTSSYAWRDGAPGVPVGVRFEAGSIFRNVRSSFSNSDVPLVMDNALVDIVDGNINFTTVTFNDVTLNVATGKTLTFSGINATVNGTLTKIGPGGLNFSGGTISAGGQGAIFEIPQMNFYGESTLSGAPIVFNGNIGVWSGSPNLATRLTYNGTFTQGDAYYDFADTDAELVVADGSTFTAANSSYSWRNVSAGTPVGVVIEDGGLFQVVVHTFSTGGVPVSNQGTIHAVSGTLNIANVVEIQSGILTAGGLWKVAAGYSINLHGTTIISNAAEVEIAGTFSGFAPQSNSGSITLLNGADLNIGNTFQNTGYLELSPGSIFFVTGLNHAASGKTVFHVAGTNPANLGRIDSSGNVTLGGSAEIDVEAPYVPQQGDTFSLINYPSAGGNFQHVDGLYLALTPAFETVVGDTAFVVNSLINAADLSTTALTSPSSGMAGGLINITYTVQNTGAFAINTPQWTDSIYLSLDGTLDAGDTLISRVPHTGALNVGESYNVNVDVPLPGKVPGTYKVIVVSESRGVIPDANRENNRLVSSTDLSLDVPTITEGVPFDGVINANQDLYFKVSMPSNKGRTFSLTTIGGGVAGMSVQVGDVPGRFGGNGFSANNTSYQEVLLPGGSAGDFYIHIFGKPGIGTANFTLFADGLDFGLSSSSTVRGSNADLSGATVTTTVKGTNFSPETQFALDGAENIPASSVVIRDSNTAFVTFSLQNRTLGNYSLVATDEALTATLTNAFQVVNTSPGVLDYSISAPSYIRAPYRGVEVTLTYSNLGETDLPAPYFTLYPTNAKLKLEGRSDYLSGPIGILATSPEGLAGIIAPGKTYSIRIPYVPTTNVVGTEVDFNVQVLGDDTPAVPWDLVKDSYRPETMPEAAWDAVFNNFKASVGDSTEQFHRVLIENANYLSQFGPVGYDTTPLIGFEFNQADEFGAISARYNVGMFGYGGDGPFTMSANADASGNIIIDNGAISRVFKLNTAPGAGSGGVPLYLPTGIEENGSLSAGVEPGTFVLSELNGTKTKFRADGKMEYLEDANGNRVTGTYDVQGRLVSLTDSVSGDQSTFAYNAAGLVSTVTDAVGRNSAYTYDAAGHLTSVSTPLGTTSFTYSNTVLHAPASKTSSNGVVTTYAYDSRGRLASATMGSGLDALTTSYSYDSAGGMTVTDSGGKQMTFYRNAFGEIAATVDQLGNTASSSFDLYGRLLADTDPVGGTTTNTYLRAGLVKSTKLADGSSVSFDYNLKDQMTRLTSAGGDISFFGFDTDGNLQSENQADGSFTNYTYDAKGRLATATNARGITVTNTYEANGLLSRRDFSTGEFVAYTYDAHRNLLTATDAEGTTTFTYNAADLMSSVTYPNGKSVSVTYDSAMRRTSVTEGGFTVNYSYDSLGRLDKLTDATAAVIVDYSYNTRGLLASETRGNGASTEYTYDDAGRIASITHRDAGAVLLEQLTYQRDDNGRVTSMNSNAGLTTYGYDLVGQLTSVDLPDGREILYTYDSDGNRTLVNDDGTPTTYSNSAGDRYSNIGGTVPVYDGSGQMTAFGSATYTYDPAGRLIGVSSGADTITYDYDALGSRIGIINNGVRTDFSVDPAGLGNVFSETTGGVSTYYAVGIGLEGQFTNGTASYYHHDVIGNTLLLTGAGGAVQNSYSYLPFGEVANQTGSLANRFTFNGATGVQDDFGNMFFMRSREYDAGMGRFLSRDPLSFGGGDTNLYRFANNDPVSFSDPTGLFAPNEINAGLQAEFALGGGVNGGIGLSTNINDILDTGPYIAAGPSAGFGGGVAATVGVSESFGGWSESAGGAVGFGGVSVGIDRSKGLSSEAINGAAISLTPLPSKFGATVAGNYTVKLTPRAALNALEAAANAAMGAANALGEALGGAMSGLENAWNNPGGLAPMPGDGNSSDTINDGYEKGGRQDGLDGPGAAKGAKDKTGKSGGGSSRYFGPGPNGGAGSGGGPGGNGPGAGRGPGSGGSAGSGTVGPADPNQMIGPGGYGAEAITGDIFTQPIRFGGYVADGGPYEYTILFENKPIAMAPAQVVTVTQTLDADFDLKTFELIKFGWADFEIFAPSGLTSWETRVDATETLGLFVDINASLNPDTRLLTVIYTSIDPLTGDIPLDPFAGFLPPNITAPEGDGFLTYSVRPNDGLATDTDFIAVASIVFDFEAPLSTPTLTNTLDSLAPTSAVTPFASATDSRGRFIVNWTASDSAEGSGLSETVVYYTDNDGPLIEFYRGTDANSKVFTDGVLGHTYKFFSIATDNVSNAEEISATPDATITVDAEMLLIGTKRTFMDTDGDTYTITLSGPGTLNAVILDPDGDGNGPLDRLILSGSTDKSKVSITVKRAKDGPDVDKLPDGDGIVSLGDLIVTGDLASFTAKATDLNVQGIIASGRLGAITVRDIVSTNPVYENMVIQSAGTALSKLKFSLIAGHIADGFEISTGTMISAITASSIGEGLISGAALASLTTKIGAMNADLDIAGIVGKVSAKTTINSGNWEAASFTSITTLGGNLDTDIESTGAIGSISVKGGSLTGGLNAFSYGKVTITGGGFSGFIGSDTLQTTLLKKPALAALTVTGGDITGTVALAGNLGSVTTKAAKNGPGGNINGATITAAAITGITAGLDVIDSLILAGASLGNDFAPGGTGDDADTYAGGLIGKVAIGRNAENSVIAAGLSSTNATYKDGDDSILSSLTSKIASLIIKGTADTDSYFAAGSFKAVPKIGGLAVTPATDARFLVV